MTVKWSELFPTRSGFITFVLYIVLFVFQGVFVTASMNTKHNYDYNVTLVVFCSEFVKLIASTVLYLYYFSRSKEGKGAGLWGAWTGAVRERQLLALYLVPSLLYCFYNNLAFVNLQHYDPTTYYLLLQFRVVITALLYQCLFDRKLTKVQWVSLSVLTAGCIVKSFDTSQASGRAADWSQIFSIYTILVNFQNFCSCLAGTYNEYLLKTKGADVDIFLQNIFMYLDSVLCNFVVLGLKGDIPTLVRDFNSLGHVFVVLIIFNSAIVGIVTSFFLKNLNSILKTYASALELVITAVVCYLLFGIIITWNTVLSIFLVSFAVVMYVKHPVVNAPVRTTSSTTQLLQSSQSV